MATALDVATHILRKQGPMTAMKLQKLVYYSQCWTLVWDSKALFEDRIEAWANGPACPVLYDKHRGLFDVDVSNIEGNPDALTSVERESVDAVLAYYGDKSSQWLSELTHAEAPWQDAREGLKPGERGVAEITKAAMAEYYLSL